MGPCLAQESPRQGCLGGCRPPERRTRHFAAEHRLLKTNFALVSGVGGVTFSYVCPHCTCFPLEDYTWWVSSGHGDGNNRKRKHCNLWCAARGGQYGWKVPNKILVIQLSANAKEAKVFRAHAGADWHAFCQAMYQGID